MYNVTAINTWINSTKFLKYKNYRINCHTHKCERTIDSKDNAIIECSDDLIRGIYEDLQELTSERGMPIRFMAVMIAFSESLNVEDAFGEWEMSEIKSNTNTDCICSHWIEQNLFVRNINNGNILVIGNECIKKFPFDNVVKEIARKQLNIKKKLDKNKIYEACERCGHYIVPTGTTPCYCLECYGIICEMERLTKERETERRIKEELEKIRSGIKLTPNRVSTSICAPSNVPSLTNLEHEFKILSRRIRICRPCEECGNKRLPIDSDDGDICGECLFKMGFKPCNQCEKVKCPEEVRFDICDECFSNNMDDLNVNYDIRDSIHHLDSKSVSMNWIKTKCLSFRNQT
ncbi:Hypothetical protein HVR_LOCUS872 [uncultured virus]|nr:Hypothetical protein HVR_LOCUS872 [uncultured virus]